MKTLFGLLVVSFVLMLGGSYAWRHMRHTALKTITVSAPAPQQEQEDPPSYAEEQEARGVVTIHGPLMDYVARSQEPQVETPQDAPPTPKVSRAASKSVAGGSVTRGTVAGGTFTILQQTFQVRKVVQVPFEVPARSASPRLYGNYHSSLKQGTQASDTDADVEFLVLNDQQFRAFLNGSSGETTFSADDAHDQQVNVSLPPTFDKSAQYHLIFRNNSKTARSKTVQADFRIDF